MSLLKVQSVKLQEHLTKLEVGHGRGILAEIVVLQSGSMVLIGTGKTEWVSCLLC